MTTYHDDIKLECNSCSSKCISRSQLIRVLNSFDYPGLATLVKVTRKRNQLKTGKTSTEISYYISNQVTVIKEFTSAIRNHWCVEVNNRIRDVNFGEDHLKSFKNNLQRTVSSVLTMVLNLLLSLIHI